MSEPNPEHSTASEEDILIAYLHSENVGLLAQIDTITEERVSDLVLSNARINGLLQDRTDYMTERDEARTENEVLRTDNKMYQDENADMLLQLQRIAEGRPQNDVVGNMPEIGPVNGYANIGNLDLQREVNRLRDLSEALEQRGLNLLEQNGQLMGVNNTLAIENLNLRASNAELEDTIEAWRENCEELGEKNRVLRERMGEREGR